MDDMEDQILGVLGPWPMALHEITRRLPEECRNPEQVHRALKGLVKRFEVRKQYNRYSLYPPHHWG